MAVKITLRNIMRDTVSASVDHSCFNSIGVIFGTIWSLIFLMLIPTLHLRLSAVSVPNPDDYIQKKLFMILNTYPSI